MSARRSGSEWAKAQAKSLVVVCAYKKGWHEEMVKNIALALDKAVQDEREANIKAIEQADPLEAKGDFWEYGGSDDVAYGIQRYLVKILRNRQDGG